MEYRHKVPPLEEVRGSRPMLRNPVREFKMNLRTLERFALFMTRRIGSMGFFIFLLFWTLIWLGWNIFGPIQNRFDPAPAFVIWLFVSNILQLIFLPLIMVGQNIESRTADARAQADFEVNQKTEKEVEVIIAHLENQNELLLELMKKTERR